MSPIIENTTAEVIPNFAKTLTPEYAGLWELTYLPLTTYTGFLGRICPFKGYIEAVNKEDLYYFGDREVPEAQMNIYADFVFRRMRGYLRPHVQVVNRKHEEVQAAYDTPDQMLTALKLDKQYRLSNAMIDGFNLKAKRLSEYAFALAVTKPELIKRGLWSISVCRFDYLCECLQSAIERTHCNHPDADSDHHRALDALEVLTAQTKSLLTGVLSGGWIYQNRPGFTSREPVITQTVRELYPDRFEWMQTPAESAELH